MYKRVIGAKRRSAVAAAIVVFLFCGVFFALAGDVGKVVSALVFVGVISLLVVSMKQYNERIENFESSYGGDLEADINSCSDSVAEKYFFLQECIADLESAKLIYYDDIKSVEGVHTGTHMAANGGLSAGFAITIHMLDGSTNLIAALYTGTSSTPSEKRRCYNEFLSKLSVRRPDLLINDRLL